MRNILLVIAYDGSAFYGYQKQPEKRTVQGELQHALFQMHGGRAVEFHAAGRTDRGVHAEGQCVNVKTFLDSIPDHKFACALNTVLPRDIRTLSSKEVPEEFHARYSACWRLYRYSYCLVSKLLPQQRFYRSPLAQEVDVEGIRAELKQIEGKRNFASFCKQLEHSSIRTVRYTDVVLEGAQMHLYISANGFLRGMVRAIAGTLIEREIKRQRGEEPAESIADILDKKNRSFAGTAAPPQGLALVAVEYDD